MKKQRCYIYTRVFTAMQVDGFSLDAQKEKLKKYADYQDMVVVREFSDEGKSGKNVDGRPQFKEMLELIEAGTDDIDYVLVLSFLVLEEMPLMFLALFRRCRISESIRMEGGSG